MNFDVEGKIIAQGDFFDFGGMVDAVYSKNLVIIEVEVKKGKKQEMLDLLNSEQGLPTTASYDGCYGYEMFFNDETSTFYLIENWESYEKYAVYLNWRQTEDDFISKMIPLMRGGEKGLKVAQPNSSYYSF
ncbi:MAG: quinol monooxygenase YgiN [Candidatus Arcticimaribacter sp.]|jgi:quinol monooxygenase YgiN